MRYEPKDEETIGIDELKLYDDGMAEDLACEFQSK
jgi:hypothetical protein